MYTERQKRNRIKKVKSVIVENEDLYFIADVVPAMGVSRQTFYNWCPKDSLDYNEIIELLYANRRKAVRRIRKKMSDSENAAALIASYRIVCDDDERRAINQNYVDVRANVDNKIQIGFVEAEIAPVEDESEVNVT